MISVFHVRYAETFARVAGNQFARVVVLYAFGVRVLFRGRLFRNARARKIARAVFSARALLIWVDQKAILSAQHSFTGLESRVASPANTGFH
jgi:hypothetical protein